MWIASGGNWGAQIELLQLMGVAQAIFALISPMHESMRLPARKPPSSISFSMSQ